MSDRYRIFETDVFQEDMDRFPKSTQAKVIAKIRGPIYSELRVQPYFGRNIKKLAGFAPPTWRYRLGDFRIFYTIDDKNKIVSILTIADRKDAY